MFKRLVLIARKAGFSPTQFRTHWSGPHADIIKRIIAHFPDAERIRYTQNRVVRTLWQHSSSAQSFNVDGFVEVHLTAKTPPEAAVSSGAVASMLEDELRFLSAFTECHVETEGSDLHDARAQKIIFIAAKKKEIDERTFAMAIRQAFGLDTTALQGVSQVCLNWTMATSVRQKLFHEVAPPSVLVELWVENVDMVRQLDDVGRDLMAVAVKQSAYQIDPHIVLG
jgi:EthD domain-containing protein